MSQIAPLKPPFPYYGGKTRIAPAIVELLPEHKHYIEPFAGALSVLLAKPPSVMETVNDINGDIVNFFQVLRDNRAELEAVCFLTPHSRQEHASARVLDGADPIERARRTFVLLSQGRNASLRKTGWAHFQNPAGGGSRSNYIRNMIGRFEPIAARILEVTLECRDGLTVIEEFGRFPDNLLYVDPPYLASTRTSSGYAAEFSRLDQHRVLLDALKECKAAVVLSGYPSELYESALAGWDRISVEGSRNVNNTATPETIWSNRPLHGQQKFAFVSDSGEQVRG
ncbi:DNA adenine methylase [Pseudarthrobacter sp. J64]|uniref:DNA adenine methylase n=1 Tax=Pseudarthrobacter sp. J64 TaxID=3116485 RepID=UPI002E80182A|nr:DNA adenine methylase [Pseudarthrobacter sp. J64]MEE2568589.1 DNA adenine methylase [Pseudarthrobacter sp. J64]